MAEGRETDAYEIGLAFAVPPMLEGGLQVLGEDLSGMERAAAEVFADVPALIERLGRQGRDAGPSLAPGQPARIVAGESHDEALASASLPGPASAAGVFGGRPIDRFERYRQVRVGSERPGSAAGLHAGAAASRKTGFGMPDGRFGAEPVVALGAETVRASAPVAPSVQSAGAGGQALAPVSSGVELGGRAALASIANGPSGRRSPVDDAVLQGAAAASVAPVVVLRADIGQAGIAEVRPDVEAHSLIGGGAVPFVARGVASTLPVSTLATGERSAGNRGRGGDRRGERSRSEGHSSAGLFGWGEEGSLRGGAPFGGRSVAPQHDGSGGGESGVGTVTLDGRLVGQWLSERMARDATRPGAGPTSFDPRQAPAWTPSGAL